MFHFWKHGSWGLNVIRDFKIDVCNHLCNTKRHKKIMRPIWFLFYGQCVRHTKISQAWIPRLLHFRQNCNNTETNNNRSTFSLVYQNTMRWIMGTNSMKQRPSWKAERCSAKKEIHRILWNPKVNCSQQLPPVPSLSHINTIQDLSFYLLKTHFTIKRIPSI